jgi:PKD repeat protein
VLVNLRKLVPIILILLFIIIFLNQNNVVGQPNGWSEDIRLTDAPLASGNPIIAIDGNYVYVVWQDARNNESYDDYEIYFKKSTNNGKTWSEEIRLSNAPHYSDNPKIDVNGTNIHVIWTDDREGAYKIFYNRSEDGGNSWKGEVRISPETTRGSPGLLDIAVDGIDVHVVYSDYSEDPSEDFQLYYINSSDNGQTWSPRQRLTSLIRDSCDSAIAVNGSNIHIVWMDHYDKFGTGTMGAIFYMNSSDGGLTWSEDFNLTPMNLDAAYPDIVINGDIIHVTFSEEVSGIWETHYRRSEDSGIFWSEDIQLTDWNRDHWGSSIDVYDTNVSVVWWTSWIQEPDGNGEIYHINSTDNGYSWSDNLRLTYDLERSGGADVSISDNTKHIVWWDKRDGNVEIYYKQYPIYADLLISLDGITFSNNIPNTGVTTKINATIQNIGDENASATIEFWDGDPHNGGVFINSTDVTVNITENVNATIYWIPTINGTHNIYVKITNTLETNLSNNIANKSVLVNREPEFGYIPPTYSLNEDSIENQLINLSDYTKDDLDSWDELIFSVISYSNSSIVNVSMFNGHFLSVNALTWSANDNWTGTIEIVIEVTDTLDLTNVSNQFTVTVTEVNDAPIVINPIQNFSIEEDTSDSTIVNLTDVFFDSDNSSLYYTYSGDTNISITIYDKGSITFTPLENWTGSATITFYATDNMTSPVSDSVTITVTPVNDAPIVVNTISDFNMDEDIVVQSIIDLTEIFQDVDNATLYYTYTNGNNITVIIYENGSVTFIPAENWSGIETITFYATDNLTDPISEDVTITVLPINDPPVIINPISDFNMFEDIINSSAINLSKIFCDSDNTSLNYYIEHANIDVIIHGDGIVTLIPKENWTGIETLTLYVTDNLSPLISYEVTITVIGINDPPIITGLSPTNNSNYFTSDLIYFNITVFDIDSNSFTYLWDFDDGLTSTLKNATHQFSEAGIYNVTIIVNDGLDSEIKVVTIAVEPETTNGDGNGVIDDGDKSNTLTYLWILMGIIIVVVLLLLFIWRRSKAQKEDSETEIDSVKEDSDLSE